MYVQRYHTEMDRLSLRRDSADFTQNRFDDRVKLALLLEAEKVNNKQGRCDKREMIIQV